MENIKVIEGSRDHAIKTAARMKTILPFRIHYIFSQSQTPEIWETGCGYDLRRPKALVRKGAVVEVLR